MDKIKKLHLEFKIRKATSLPKKWWAYISSPRFLKLFIRRENHEKVNPSLLSHNRIISVCFHFK
nr:MAG TPA: hypothetical protein [Caudoviricetes sp.]